MYILALIYYIFIIFATCPILISQGIDLKGQEMEGNPPPHMLVARPLSLILSLLFYNYWLILLGFLVDWVLSPYNLLLPLNLICLFMMTYFVRYQMSSVENTRIEVHLNKEETQSIIDLIY